jgi:hypothetical protein
MSPADSLDAAAADADANAGSGNVGDPTTSCPQCTTIKIRLYNDDHVPMGGAAYTLVVDGITYQGESDAAGMISHIVTGEPTSGTLTLVMWTVELTIQPLGAPEDSDGYTARLDNLGYFAEDALMALMRFQSANDLDPSGQMNDETKTKLEEVHGH